MESSHKSTSSSSCSSSSNGVQFQSPPTPKTPKTPNKSNLNPDPTTFIQVDPSSFKQIVQRLTGSTQTPTPAKSIIRPIKTGPKKQSHKLYERRNSFKNFKVGPLVSGLVQNCGLSQRELEMLSPSMLNFPSLVISPDTPLTPDPFQDSPTTYSNSKLSLVEQGNLLEKRYYFQSSPDITRRDSEPRLLPLFPMTSPKVTN
ncbi:hypothetical protein ACHQM5_017276 [Ranunculus cassubicifolius]